MADTTPRQFRPDRLSASRETTFRLLLTKEERAAMAADLDLLGLPMLEFEGTLKIVSKRDVLLRGSLRAQAVQACITTLAPVGATISDNVERRYVADYVSPEAEETEVPADDTIEPMPDRIDLVDVAREALALALPLYPRAQGAEGAGMPQAANTDANAGGPDPEDATETHRPFSGLAGLMGRTADDKKVD